jgi:uncharacterized OsmC-like protein
MRDVEYSISATAVSGTRTDVTVRDFTMVVDEPERLGGTNAGPNPLEYELASLAGCLNVTGHVVAKEMGLSIRSLTMNLSAALNPARFMGRGNEERAGFKTITVTILMDCDADDDTRERWRAAIEDRCPVSDNLAHGTAVHVTLG